ncbi:MAG: rhomboid family intramembrane serine protease [Oscillatoriophycideae cyanobacterium NC_groundwater_1537_Pr4_S-0.65um_50_18]|nr:rhomboid family intramembrane serine protease [Oscillatoriophycideae cyanobacterium NC_groundwater_1537_Pr4_S-0.65um_50_18]
MADADLLNFSAHARVLLSMTAIVWFIHLINWGIFGGWLNYALGLRPRNLWGLVGIPLSPLLHVSFKHLMGNTQAFLLFGWFILMQGIHLFYVVTIATALVSGLGCWLFGRPNSIGVGASGVTYGYIGFVLMYGIGSGSGIALLLALIVAFRDAWRITGNQYNESQLLPVERSPRMGWRAHLFGFLGGVLIALVLSDMRLN